MIQEPASRIIQTSDTSIKDCAQEDTMPKKHKRLSREDGLARDLEIVRLRLAGMTGTAIARKFRLTSGRVTQILHGVAGRLAPRTFKR